MMKSPAQVSLNRRMPSPQKPLVTYVMQSESHQLFAASQRIGTDPVAGVQCVSGVVSQEKVRSFLGMVQVPAKHEASGQQLSVYDPPHASVCPAKVQTSPEARV